MTDSDTRVEAWKPVPDASKYQVSDQGRVRRDGRVLATRVSNTGYVLVNYTDDLGKKRTRTVHRLVLEAFRGPCPPGMESLHANGPLDNRLEKLRWGTKVENEAEKPERPSLVPTFDCLNRCGNKVINQDRRCLDCVALTGRKIARMLAAGMNLEVAAVRFDLGSDWAYKIAVEHGGYSATKRDARLQQPSLSQRVAITVRDRRRDGWGDAA